MNKKHSVLSWLMLLVMAVSTQVAYAAAPDYNNGAKSGISDMLGGRSGSSSSSSQRGSSTTGSTNGHEWVDLGLPSGTLWATCNIGASSPQDYGRFYAWGETSSKSTYKEGNSVTYNTGLHEYAGQSRYDAATANWGSSWSTPTEEQVQELINNTTAEQRTMGGVRGMLFTSKKNGASIFMPSCGKYYGSTHYSEGEEGRYWTSTPSSSSYESAIALGWSDSSPVDYATSRDGGFCVRPVTNSRSGSSSRSQSSDSHQWVDMGLPSGTLWATCNLGASRPEQYGLYYSWADIDPQTASHSSPNYDYYSSTGDIQGNARYDAATQSWGSRWCMPTYRQLKELVENVDSEWTTYKGVYGRLLTSKRNGATMFLPAGGFRSGSTDYQNGEYGNYWTSTPSGQEDRAGWALAFGTGAFFGCYDNYGGTTGFLIRPVRAK